MFERHLFSIETYFSLKNAHFFRDMFLELKFTIDHSGHTNSISGLARKE